MGELKKEVVRRLFIILATALLFALTASTAFGTEFTLCTTSCDYNNLTGALLALNNTNNTLLINESGSFSVNASYGFNLSPSSTATVLRIAAQNVTLNFSASTLFANMSGYAISINNSNNITLKNLNLLNFSRGILVNSSPNVTVQDSVLTTAQDIYVNQSSPDMHVLNVTNVSQYIVANASSHLFVEWHVQVHVNNSAGTSITGASVAAYDATPSLLATKTTDTSGLVQFSLAEYLINWTDYVYYGNYSLNASTDYRALGISTNVTSNQALTLTADCLSQYDYWWNISGTLSCSNMQIVLNNNISIASGATASFENVTLIINSTQSQNFGIDNYGTLNINNSNVSAYNADIDYYWHNWVGSKVSAENSVFTDAIVDDMAPAFPNRAVLFYSNHSVLRNNQFTFDTNASQYGLLFHQAYNNTIHNNTLSVPMSDGTGLYFYNSSTSFAVDNTITVTATNTDAISAYASQVIVVLNSTITTDDTAPIRIQESQGFTLEDNALFAQNATAVSITGGLLETDPYNHTFIGNNTFNTYAIVHYRDANNQIIEDNSTWGALYVTFGDNVTIRNLTFAQNTSGVYLMKVENSSVYDITLNDVTNTALDLYEVGDTTFENISIASARSTAQGMTLYQSNANTLRNVSILLTAATNGQRALQLLNTTTQNNVVYNSVFNATNATVLLFSSAGSGNDFVNTYLRSDNPNSIFTIATSFSMRFVDATIESVNATFEFPTAYLNTFTFINTTMNESALSFAAGTNTTYTIKNYLDAVVNASGGAVLPSVNVSAYNVSGHFHASQLTSSNGLIRLNLTDHLTNATTTIYHNNYSINTTVSGYNPSAESVNMSTNQYVTFALTCLSVVDYWWNITSSAECNNVQITLNNNLTITGAAEFNNVTLIINATTTRLGIDNQGNLTINNSNVTAGNTSQDIFWWTTVPGWLILENTVVSEVGYNASTDNERGGIMLGSNSSRVSNVTITLENEDKEIAFSVYQGYSNVIEDSTIIVAGNNSQALLIKEAHANTVRNNIINSTAQYLTNGITIYDSENNSFVNNTVELSTYYSAAHYIRRSAGNTFENVSCILQSGQCFDLWALSAPTPEHTAQTMNGVTVNGLPLYYTNHQTGITIQNNATIGELILANVSHSVFQNITITNAGVASFIYGDNITISDLTIENNGSIALTLLNISNAALSNLTLGTNQSQTLINLALIEVSDTVIGDVTIEKGVTSESSWSVYLDQIRNLDIYNAYIRQLTGSSIVQQISTATNLTFYNLDLLINGSVAGVSGVSLLSSGANVSFVDSALNATDAATFSLGASTLGITTVNSTFNGSIPTTTGSGSVIIDVGNYLDVFVNNTLGTPIANVNVSALNVSSDFVDSALTLSTGRTRLTLTNYFFNVTDYIYQNNYTINLNTSSWSTTVSLNMSQSQYHTATLNQTVPTISVIQNITYNISTSGNTTPAQTFTFNLSQFASDTDGDDLNYSALIGPNVTLGINNDTGMINITPDAGFFNTSWIIFNASDSVRSALSNNVTITVARNYAPTFSSIPSITIPWNVSTLVNLTTYTNDTESDDVNYTALLGPNVSVKINNVTNIATLTPSPGWSGSTWAIFNGTDGLGYGESNNVTITVTQNAAPNITNISTVTFEMNLNDTILLSGHAADAESDNYTLTAVAGPNLSVIIGSDSSYTTIIEGDTDFNGTTYFSINVSDSYGRSVLSNNVTVNITYLAPGALTNMSEYISDAITTNLSALSSVQLTNVTNFTLARLGTVLRWPSSTYLLAQNIDSAVQMDAGFVSLNPSGLHSTLTGNGQITFSGVNCSDYQIFYSATTYTTRTDTISNGISCPGGVCSSVSCSGDNVTFTVSSFSSYAVSTVPIPVIGSTSKGGGGSIGTVTKSYASRKSRAEKNEPVLFSYNNRNIAVDNITILTDETIPRLRVDINAFKKGSEYFPTIHNPYQSFKVNIIGRLPKKHLTSLQIGFSVEQKWFEELPKNETIRWDEIMLHFLEEPFYNKSGWVPIETTFVHNDTENVFYSAIVPWFGEFAIGPLFDAPPKPTGEKVYEPVSTPVVTAAEPVVESTPPPKPQQETKQSTKATNSVTGNAVSEVTQEAQPFEKDTGQEEEQEVDSAAFDANIMWITSIVVILAGIVAAAIVFLMMHKKKKGKAKQVAKTSAQPTDANPKVTQINKHIREELIAHQTAPDNVHQLISQTREWIHTELAKNRTDQQIIAALQKTGWEEELARHITSEVKAHVAAEKLLNS